jgi:RNA polymerase sigma factor (sigma-70 family)
MGPRKDTVFRHLRSVLRQDGAGRTDEQLLASFVDRKDEVAFESLVRRHGPMVFGACLRVTRNHHDAEDAFQATFLVLARKASSVQPRERLASWLHGVALRTALKARATAARRRGREKQVPEMPEPETAQQEHWRDLGPLLDQELNGLPENYRLPILLCGLEGKTIKEATRQLGWPQGTLAGRLARGRRLLAKRLARRGVVLSAGALASAGVPSALLSSTAQAAMRVVAGQAVAGVVPARVAALTEGVMRGMMLSKLSKAALVGLVVLGAVAFGGGLLTQRTATGQQTKLGQDGDNPAAGQPAPPRRGAGPVKEAGAKHAPAKTDLERLQGVWSVVSTEQGGKRLRPERAVFMVDRNRACWQSSDSEIQGGLYLETTGKPRAYDLAMSTRTIEGIYSLEGDTLRLCYDPGHEAKRPARFSTARGSPRALVVLKRLHGPEVFPYRLADGTRAFPTLIERARKPQPPPQIARVPRDSRPVPYRVTARVGNIIVVGNTRTPASEVLERIPLRPGDVLDYQALRAAEKKLAGLNLTITVVEDGASADFKDVRVTVKEK